MLKGGSVSEFVRDEASEFIIWHATVVCLVHHQVPPEQNLDVPWAWGAPQNLGVEKWGWL